MEAQLESSPRQEEASRVSPEPVDQGLGAFQDALAPAGQRETARGLLKQQHDSAVVQATIDVDHVQQQHYTPGQELLPETLLGTAKSQHEVACHVAKHPDPLVFDEGATYNHTAEQYEAMKKANDSGIRIARTLFPDGIPEKFEDLNETQRFVLYQWGGVRTLYLLGELDAVYRSIDPEAADRIFGELDALEEKHGRSRELLELPEYKHLEMDAREAELLEEVQAALALPENRGRPVVVVYGKAHDFSQEFPGRSGFALGTIDTVPADKDRPAFRPLAEIRSFEGFKGDLDAACMYFAGVQAAPDYSIAHYNQLVAEGKKLLDHVQAQGLKLNSWQWSQLPSAPLMSRGLQYLDPGTISPESMPLEEFKAVLRRDPKLAEVGAEWVTEHFPEHTLAGPAARQDDPAEADPFFP